MKELSIEQKAKRYDEAFETARKINSGDGVEAPPDWTTCEVIFPELKESEDERIRKEFCKDIWNYIPYEKAHKYIAWLEKQGEQKSAWSEGDKNILRLSIVNLTELKHRFGKGYGKVGDCIDWLESLKDRYTWKPSDEQMLAINTAINVLGKGTLNGKQLIKLQEQLKKLRGE